MATWTSGVDVLDDLDKLSEFSAGCDHIKDIPIVAYSSYGRGSLIGDKEALRTPSPKVEEDFQLPQSFQPGAGRGERISAFNEKRHDSPIQQQLRMVMGPGYSNSLIEYYTHHESSSDHSSKSEQFDDPQECISSYEAMPDQSLQEGISSYNTLQDCSDHPAEPTSYSSSLTAEAVNVENTDTVTLTKDLQPKKPVRRNRNALLNSLPNYSAVGVAESGIKGEMKTKIQVQDYNSSFDYGFNCTDNTSDNFKSIIEVPLPNQVGRTSVNDFKIHIKNTDSHFQFREEDFPPL
jgi:hypothetical protein